MHINGRVFVCVCGIFRGNKLSYTTQNPRTLFEFSNIPILRSTCTSTGVCACLSGIFSRFFKEIHCHTIITQTPRTLFEFLTLRYMCIRMYLDDATTRHTPSSFPGGACGGSGCWMCDPRAPGWVGYRGKTPGAWERRKHRSGMYHMHDMYESVLM